ncbi:MAG: protein phosphatase 2C domain-containing protein [Myxococcota bacterium]
MTAQGDGGSVETVQGKLHGEASDAIGAISAIAEGAAAIALSIGGARKTYEHTDPNEDGAAFAIGPAGVLVAVADGHGGRDAARLAIDMLMGSPAQRWTAEDGADFQQNWAERARDEIVAIQNAILASRARVTAYTTLAIAVVRPADDCIAFAAVGDSHIFRVDEFESFDLGYYPERRSCYLGRPSDNRETLSDMCLTGVEPLGTTLAIVLATDGISERGIGVDVPETTVFECVSNAQQRGPELRTLDAARSIAEAANTAHRFHRSGDNIATAVAWIGARIDRDRLPIRFVA